MAMTRKSWIVYLLVGFLALGVVACNVSQEHSDDSSDKVEESDQRSKDAVDLSEGAEAEESAQSGSAEVVQIQSPSASENEDDFSSITINGVVSDGVALTSRPVVILDAAGKTFEAGQSNNKGEFSIQIPIADITFPIVIQSDQSDDDQLAALFVPTESTLEALVQTGEPLIANVNPVTVAVSSEFLDSDSEDGDSLSRHHRLQRSLENVDFSQFNSNVILARGDAFTTAVFGESISFASFNNQVFSAKTSDNPSAGNFADTLIDTIQRTNPFQSTADILAIAADPNDPTYDGAARFMDSSSFQARVSGEMVAQGRSSDAITSLVESGVSDSADVETLKANTRSYAQAFDNVAQEALNQGGSAADLEAVITSAAEVASNAVEASGGNTLEEIANVVQNSVSAVGGALVEVMASSSSDDNKQLLLSSVGAELTKVISDVTADLTQPLDASELQKRQKQAINFSQAIATPLANALKDDALTLGAEQQQVLAKAVSGQVSEALAPYLDSLATADSLDDIPAAVNTAANLTSTLSSAMSVSIQAESAQAVNRKVLHSAMKQMAQQTQKQLEKNNIDLSSNDSTAIQAASNLATNLSELVMQTTGSTSSLGDDSSRDAIMLATIEQTLSAVSTLDLTQEMPDSARTITQNINAVIGPALAEAMGSSSRKGDTLQVLAKSAAATMTAELAEEGVDLTQEIGDMAAVTESAKQKATSAGIQMEQTFQKIETAGIALSQVTKSFEGTSLNPSVMGVVASQVAETLASGSELGDSAAQITQAAAIMANSAVERGASIDSVRESVSVTAIAMANIAKQTAGDATEKHAQKQALLKTMQLMSENEESSLDDLTSNTKTVAAVISTSDGGASSDVIEHVRDNKDSETPIQAESLVQDSSQLESINEQKDSFDKEAESSRTKAQEEEKRSEAIANQAVQSGQSLDEFEGSEDSGSDETKDELGPVIVEADLDYRNAFMDLTFNEAVYGSNNESLKPRSFVLSDIREGSGITKWEITHLSNHENQLLQGGETEVRVHFRMEGTSNGTGFISLTPSANQIFDVKGNASGLSVTTGLHLLHDHVAPQQAKIQINGGERVNSLEVTLSLAAEDAAGVSGYFLSHDDETPSLEDSGWVELATKTRKLSRSQVKWTLNEADEVHDVYVWFRDAAGNLSEVTQDLVILDQTAPEVDVQKLPHKKTLSGNQIELDVAIQEEAPGETQFYLNGEKLSEKPGETLDGIEDGEHRLAVVHVDEAGNRTIETVQFVVDTTAPKIVIASPKDGAVLNSKTIDFDHLVLEKNQGEERVLLNGKELNGDTADLEDGEHTLIVEHIDKAGHKTVATSAFTIDTVSPEAMLIRATDEHTSQEGMVVWVAAFKDADEFLLDKDKFVVHASDGVTGTLEMVEIRDAEHLDEVVKQLQSEEDSSSSSNNSDSGSSNTDSSDSTGATSTPSNNSDEDEGLSLPDGFEVKALLIMRSPKGNGTLALEMPAGMAEDDAGNRTDAKKSEGTIIDNTVPQIQISSLSDGQVLTSTQLTLNFTVTDENPDQSRVFLDGVRVGETSGLSLNLSVGEHRLDVEHEDKARNRTNVSLSFEVKNEG